jgi:outer membrane PBP1 activator LpoA protein
MSPMPTRSAMPFPRLPLLAGAALLATALGACTTTMRPRSAPAAVEAAAREPQAIAEARVLARDGVQLSGVTRSENDARIERLLAQLDNDALARAASAMPEGDPLYNYAGRALLRRGLPLPRPFDRAAASFGADDRPPADRDGYRPPQRVAVLLPLTGELAVAAAPVRDGLLAAYYGETRRRPEITFYDSTGGAVAAYERAVAAGSDLVIGPLERSEVDAVFRRGTLPVPVLALNRGAVDPPAGHASFSLSPEDEGVGAAEYLLARGARNVLVVANNDDTQRRAVAALRARLAERGAQVTAVVPNTTEDFAPFAQPATPVDAVFLAVRGSTARELVPKLALAGLGDRPRVATSQLLSGTGKAEQDRVLDGIAFPVETWTNRGLPGLPSAESVGARLPSARGPAARLFAFGHDAWRLAAYLEHLARTADGRLDGATGVLRLDGFGNVQRTPAWSTFIGGRPVPLSDAGRG